jgi:hypothetical protein
MPAGPAPAKAGGRHPRLLPLQTAKSWIPAYAGMTVAVVPVNYPLVRSGAGRRLSRAGDIAREIVGAPEQLQRAHRETL